MKVIVIIIKSGMLAGLVLFISACSDNTGPATNSVERFSVKSTDALGSYCSVAMAPNPVNDELDERIAQLQRLWQNDNRSDYLEKLGWTYITKARSSFDPGFYILAEQSAKCLQQDLPDSVDALLLLSHIAHQKHQFEEAETLARRLVNERGYWFDYAVLGDALIEQGKLDAAIDAYQAMVDRKPGPQAYARIAHVRWLTGDVADAVALMQQAVRASSPRDVESAAWWRVRLALYQWQFGKSETADQHVREVLTNYPDYAPALLLKGRMLLARNENSAAVDALTYAATLSPLPEYQWALIEALKVAGQDDQARLLADQLQRRGAIDDRRTYALYLATIGEDTERALALSQAELSVREDVLTLDTVAWALWAAGRSGEAKEYSERALVHGTDDARLYLHAALIATETGDVTSARQWFEKAQRVQHMLLPSERALLERELAAVQPQVNSSST